MSRIEVSRRRGRNGILTQSTGPPTAHGNRRHNLRPRPLALVALRPFGPVDVVAVRALPVADGVGVVRCLWGLWGLVLRRHRRRRRRRRHRGHGRARRLRIRAASTIMARLVRVVDAVAVLRAVDDAHIMVSYSTRVLAVFIITGAAAVLHRCLHRAATALWLCWCGLHWAWFCATARCEEWTSAAMEDECGSAGARGVRRPLGCARPQIELASRDILATPPSTRSRSE